MTQETVISVSLKAYLQLLKKNEIKKSDVARSEHFARLIISKLGEQTITSVAYRNAVNLMLNSIPDMYRSHASTVARELFPFLTSDFKSVALLMSTGNYRGIRENCEVLFDCNIKSIDEMLKITEVAILSERESAIHSRYLSYLSTLGIAQQAIHTRARLSKAVMYLTRNIDLDNKSYSALLDSMLPLFSLEETKKYLVSIAREFYFFLNEDINAPAQAAASFEKSNTTISKQPQQS
ncbi:hypothetical protein [Sulfurirhabdus autotrophica]|uniref:Uncharacterized protein n=1 Tax=Sulfurirhabdus autotrophica TaxID=1706046 RepID=A0A4R3Y586_9PROT|nr:hypothetical protein [Sulfurirhabdus autotrophica]TCV87405.1 hypothetical protein EDC63_10574 [Sulfurirhabdus autotrophica]